MSYIKRFEDEICNNQRNRENADYKKESVENSETIHFKTTEDAEKAKTLVTNYCCENNFKITHMCCSGKGYMITRGEDEDEC